MDRDLWCVVVVFLLAYAPFPAKAAPLMNPEHSQNQDERCYLCIVRQFCMQCNFGFVTVTIVLMLLQFIRSLSKLYRTLSNPIIP